MKGTKDEGIGGFHLIVDVESLEGESIHPTPIVNASGTSTPTPTTIVATTSHPPLTQAVILMMGNLAYSTYV